MNSFSGDDYFECCWAGLVGTSFSACPWSGLANSWRSKSICFGARDATCTQIEWAPQIPTYTTVCVQHPVAELLLFESTWIAADHSEIPGALLPSNPHLLQTILPVTWSANNIWCSAWEKSEQTNHFSPEIPYLESRNKLFLKGCMILGGVVTGKWQGLVFGYYCRESQMDCGCRARPISLCLEWMNVQPHSVSSMWCNTGYPMMSCTPLQILCPYYNSSSQKKKSQKSISIYKSHTVWTDLP